MYRGDLIDPPIKATFRNCFFSENHSVKFHSERNVALAGIQKFESSGDDINSTFKISNGFVLAHSFQVYQNAFLQNFFW